MCPSAQGPYGASYTSGLVDSGVQWGQREGGYQRESAVGSDSVPKQRRYGSIDRQTPLSREFSVDLLHAHALVTVGPGPCEWSLYTSFLACHSHACLVCIAEPPAGCGALSLHEGAGQGRQRLATAAQKGFELPVWAAAQQDGSVSALWRRQVCGLAVGGDVRHLPAGTL